MLLCLPSDVEGRVPRCNTTAERLVQRENAIGHRCRKSFFAADFAETLAQLLGKSRNLNEVRHALNYCRRATTEFLCFKHCHCAAVRRTKHTERFWFRRRDFTCFARKIATTLSVSDCSRRASRTRLIRRSPAFRRAYNANAAPERFGNRSKRSLEKVDQKQTDRASNIVGNLPTFLAAAQKRWFYHSNPNKFWKIRCSAKFNCGAVRQLDSEYDSTLPPFGETLEKSCEVLLIWF